jgi:hypothetical protein
MRLARALISRGIGPAWARQAYRDEQNMRLLLAFTTCYNYDSLDWTIGLASQKQSISACKSP